MTGEPILHRVRGQHRPQTPGLDWASEWMSFDEAIEAAGRWWRGYRLAAIWVEPSCAARPGAVDVVGPNGLAVKAVER